MSEVSPNNYLKQSVEERRLSDYKALYNISQKDDNLATISHKLDALSEISQKLTQIITILNNRS